MNMQIAALTAITIQTPTKLPLLSAAPHADALPYLDYTTGAAKRCRLRPPLLGQPARRRLGVSPWVQTSPSRTRHSCSRRSTPRSSARPSEGSSNARRMASRSGIVSATTSTFLVVGVLESFGRLVESSVAKAARELENVPVVYRDAGESHGGDRTFDRCGRVSELSAEVERAGSAFGVPGNPSLLGRWVADPATLLALVARSPA